MIDPADAESVIQAVAKELAQRFRWLEVSDLANDAQEIGISKGYFRRATTPGALHHWLRVELIRTYEAEEGDRQQTDSWETLVEEYSDTLGCAMTLTHVPGDTAPKHVPGQQSHLFDKFASMSKDDFMAWGEQQFGGQWAKKRDLRTLLYGYEDEIERLWAKYARNKRKYGEGGLSGLTLTERQDYPEVTWYGYRRHGAEEWSVDDDFMIEDPYEWGSSRHFGVDRRAVNLFWPRPLRALATA